jgi:hypothetical protein
MTRAEILAKVRRHIDDVDGDSWDDVDILPLIEDNTEHVQGLILSLDSSYYTKPGTFAIKNTVEFYDLPSDFNRMSWLNDENHLPLSRLFNTAYRSRFLEVADTRLYYFRGSQIGFLRIPTSDKTYIYEYVRTPTKALPQPTSIPDVPVFLCHAYIAIRTALDILAMDEEEDRHLMHRSKEHETDIIEHYHRRNEDSSPYVPSDESLDLEL